jgi:hypothetical protein
MKKAIAVLFLLLLCVAAFADRLDGNFWNKLSEDGKAVLLLGLSEGQKISIFILLDNGEELIADTVVTMTADERILSDVVKDINAFYAKEKNLGVGIYRAYMITLAESKKPK